MAAPTLGCRNGGCGDWMHAKRLAHGKFVDLVFFVRQQILGSSPRMTTETSRMAAERSRMTTARCYSAASA
jgi:hypothetical protein